MILSIAFCQLDYTHVTAFLIPKLYKTPFEAIAQEMLLHYLSTSYKFVLACH